MLPSPAVLKTIVKVGGGVFSGMFFSSVFSSNDTTTDDNEPPTQISSSQEVNVTAMATTNLTGAVNLAPGRSLLPNESKLQEACAATHVISDLDPSLYSKAICTHSGSFHCDEALAIGLLKLLPKWRDYPVIRTRSTPIHNMCEMVVDVGGTHDHANCRYDHHQKKFNAEFQDITLGKETGFTTKLSSAGLVYKYYGKEILNEVRLACGAPEEDAAMLEKIWKKIYAGFIEHVDGIDNGIDFFEGGTPNYLVSTTLSSRVGDLNPEWDQESGDIVLNTLFKEAMMLTQKEFLEKVKREYTNLKARSIVKEAIVNGNVKDGKDGKEEIDGQILVFSQVCPWEDHLFELETEHDIVGKYKYMVFPDGKGGGNIRAVPVAYKSFTSRKALPKPWRGLRDQELSDLTGIDGCVFTHNAGFCGANKTFEGAMAMTRMAVQFQEE